jgi:hypothetical protein
MHTASTSYREGGMHSPPPARVPLRFPPLCYGMLRDRSGVHAKGWGGGRETTYYRHG